MSVEYIAYHEASGEAVCEGRTQHEVLAEIHADSMERANPVKWVNGCAIYQKVSNVIMNLRTEDV